MTSMQVEYSKLKETQRHNQAMEQQQAAELEETKRSHKVNEALGRDQLNEVIRNNQAVLTETMRHNNASEAEIARHNKASETILVAQNETQRYLGEINAAIQQDKVLKQYEIDKAKNATDFYFKELQNAINERQTTATEKKVEAECAKLKADTTKSWEQISQDWASILSENEYRAGNLEVQQSKLTADIAQRNVENEMEQAQYELDKTTRLIGSVNQTLSTIRSFIPIPNISIKGDLGSMLNGSETVEESKSSKTITRNEYGETVGEETVSSKTSKTSKGKSSTKSKSSASSSKKKAK